MFARPKLLSIVIFALTAATALECAKAQSGVTPSTYIAIDGGQHCVLGERAAGRHGHNLGESGCGARFGVEVGQTGGRFIWDASHWAIRMQLARSIDNEAFRSSSLAVDDSFIDKRLLVDAELGFASPWQMFGGSTRLTLGVRFSQWQGQLQATTIVSSSMRSPLAFNVVRPLRPPIVVVPIVRPRPLSPGGGVVRPLRPTPAGLIGQLSEQEVIDTSSLGVRVGWRSTIPLGTHWMVESYAGAAIMLGRATRSETLNMIDQNIDDSSRTGIVLSIDSTTLLSYKLTGADTGPIISAGLLSEVWMNQTASPKLSGANRFDRLSWSPVVRFRMSLQ